MTPAIPHIPLSQPLQPQIGRSALERVLILTHSLLASGSPDSHACGPPRLLTLGRFCTCAGPNYGCLRRGGCQGRTGKVGQHGGPPKEEGAICGIVGVCYKGAEAGPVGPTLVEMCQELYRRGTDS